MLNHIIVHYIGNGIHAPHILKGEILVIKYIPYIALPNRHSRYILEHGKGSQGLVPPTRCESVDRNGTRSRREGKGTFPMITSQATHRKENLTNLAIFPVAENGEIGKEISSFDKKQCDWRV